MSSRKLSELEEAYLDAWEERENSREAQVWEAVIADGLDAPGSAPDWPDE